MAINPQKRQKQLAKKKAKRKTAAKKMVNTISNFLSSHSMIATAPIHECFVPSGLFASGIGTVFISRKMPNGDIVAGFFMLDAFCLGVKNAFFRELSPSEYQQFYSEIKQTEEPQPSSPACARKLIEDCVSYAKSIGMEAHPDYKEAKKIFGDINTEECSDEFVFGKDGKPFYFSGPYDTQEKIKKIVNKLTKTCGPDGFHYVMATDSDDYEGEDDFNLKA